MAPRAKVSKGQILEAALDMVREGGIGPVNARSLAAKLGCSTQPIFSNFPTMDDLKAAVCEAAYARFRASVQRCLDEAKYPPYKAVGMAYVLFAKEEPKLFYLLFAENRPSVASDASTWGDAVTMVADSSIAPSAQAERFHLETWVFTHGLASLTASGVLPLTDEQISSMISEHHGDLVRRYNPPEED